MAVTDLQPSDPSVEARKRAERLRFPFDALERLIPVVDQIGYGPGATEQTADALGITVQRVRNYRRSGLTATQADEFACHLGLVPELIEGLGVVI